MHNVTVRSTSKTQINGDLVICSLLNSKSVPVHSSCSLNFSHRKLVTILYTAQYKYCLTYHIGRYYPVVYLSISEVRLNRLCRASKFQ